MKDEAVFKKVFNCIVVFTLLWFLFSLFDRVVKEPNRTMYYQTIVE